mmetsp:Transcript_87701/g.160425  ORF Transcript_87701/g.160425 Transcript_87701/m.160425 type:complete len:242 (+) Transcript_87701:893-1618(+)
MVEADKHLCLATECKVGLTLVLELNELLLIDDLDCALVTRSHVHAQSDLTEVATAQDRAHIPLIAHPLLLHQLGAMPCQMPGTWCCCHICHLPAAGLCFRSSTTGIALIGSNPEDVGREGLDVSLLLRVHAQGNLISMLKSTRVTLLHDVLVDETAIVALPLQKVMHVIVPVDPQVESRDTRVLNCYVAIGVAAYFHLSRLFSQVESPTRVGQRDEASMHPLVLLQQGILHILRRNRLRLR